MRSRTIISASREGPAGTKVSWQLTGLRKDAWARAHPLVVEQDKPGGITGVLR